MSENFSKIRDATFKEFNKCKGTYLRCPAISKEIKFKDECFNHITYKDDRHIRTQQEQEMRFLCFLNAKNIIEKSYLYQEYMAETIEVEIKKNGNKIREKRLAQYYGLVGIVEKNGEKHRIRVVIRDVQGFQYAEYRSVMPAWRMKGYKTFMGPLT